MVFLAATSRFHFTTFYRWCQNLPIGILGAAFFMVTPNQLYYGLIIYFPRNAKKKIASREIFPLVCLWVTASDLKLRRYEYFLRVHSRSGKRNSSQFSLSLNSHNAFRRLKETDFHLPSFAPFPCWRKVWETRVCANLKLIKFHNSTRRYFNLSRSRFLSVCGSNFQLYSMAINCCVRRRSHN